MPFFIKAKQDQGRYRSGQFHSARGRVWPDNAFTKEQLAAIKKDTMLAWKKLSTAEAEEKCKELGQKEAVEAEAPGTDAAETEATDAAAQGEENGKAA